MATIGQSLTSPEAGWKRYDDRDTVITYEGKWLQQTHASHYLTTLTYTNTPSSKIKFNFTGNKLRIIVNAYTNNETNTKITIDNKIFDSFSTKAGSGEVFQCLAYEKIGLSNGEHNVVIETTSTSTFRFDAIDIDEKGKLLKFTTDLSNARLAIKNENKYYSLTDSVLIHLPDNSSKSMILYGIEKDKEIQLNVPFNKHIYVNNTPIVNTNSKIFTVPITDSFTTIDIKDNY